MLGIISFAVSIISVIMSFFANIRLASFAIAMLGIVLAVISTYDKDTVEAKEETKTKQSRALEVGALVVSASAIFSYFVFTILAAI